jgi:hypothetical protein
VRSKESGTWRIARTYGCLLVATRPGDAAVAAKAWLSTRHAEEAGGSTTFGEIWMNLKCQIR